jgi:hypothetical protein
MSGNIVLATPGLQRTRLGTPGDLEMGDLGLVPAGRWPMKNGVGRFWDPSRRVGSARDRSDRAARRGAPGFDAMGRARSIAPALLWLWLATGCGQTLVMNVPKAPPLPFQKQSAAHDKKDDKKEQEDAHALAECPFMTVMIDYSRQGNVEIGARVAAAMKQEFEALGTRVTSSTDQAYWSLMILASESSRKDGYIFSAMLSARNMNEGYDPGVTVFQRDKEKQQAEQGKGDPHKVPTLYNGLSYGPYATLEDQSRNFVRQAYAAVFPFAKELCAFEDADRKREHSLEQELPAQPAPL